MLFNTPEYAAFLVVVVAGYLRLPHRAQNILLLAASYLFYAHWDARFLILILVSTIVDFAAGLMIHRARHRDHEAGKKAWLVASLVTNLGILGFFKYYGFFSENLNALLATVGLDTSIEVLNVILPIGISFYTFQTLSYTIDVYRGKIDPIDNPLDFALFVAFFPQLVAGPIERASHLIPQIRRPRTVTLEHWRRGLFLILTGLVRKVVIADTAGILVDQNFAAPYEYSSLQLASGLILYSIQIYGDFAGYSNIARGSAQLLGFDLMRNFRHPYLARNPSDFWRRWHISLSTWLRDYLYIPLGGNRRGARRTHANLMVTMLLGGLWHGASWNFVLWGFLHGAYLSLHRLLVRERPVLPSEAEERVRERREEVAHRTREAPRSATVSLDIFAQGIATFSLTTFTWLFFRSPDIETTRTYLEGLASFTFSGAADLVTLVLLSALVLVIDIPQALTRDEYVFLRLPGPARALLVAGSVVMLLLSGEVGDAFIYFQF